MKRLFALTLAFFLLISFTGCQKSSAEGTLAHTESPSAPSTQATQAPSGQYADSLAVLTAIWDSYQEADKFAVLGGNRGAMVENAPGAFDLTAAQEMTSMLLLPAEHIGKLKSAASMVHMLNGNTFTSGVFQTDGNLEDFSKILVDAANSTAFVCGAPQLIVTLKVEDYVIMAFGTEDLVGAFKNYALGLDGATLIYDGPIRYDPSGDSNGAPVYPIPLP